MLLVEVLMYGGRTLRGWEEDGFSYVSEPFDDEDDDLDYEDDDLDLDEELGDIGTEVADELFGDDAPYSVDYRTGTLVRPKEPTAPSGDPRKAARDATVELQRVGGQVQSPIGWAVDVTGASAEVPVSGSSRTLSKADQISAQVAASHGVTAFKAVYKANGKTSYVFTTRPTTAAGLGRIGGYDMSRLSR